jgi:heterodisulfide reductase subunit B
MTTYAYYPGCSLDGTSKEYDASSRLVCQTLGLQLQEVADWNCCGGSSAHMVNPWLGLALSARNLRQIEGMGLDRVTVPCSACYGRLREAEHALKDETTCRRMTEEVGIKVEGKVTVEHLLDTLSQPAWQEKARPLVKKPLTGLKVACYYGCLITRPREIVAFDDVENPQRMDELMRLVGAEAVPWPFKTECCGAVMMTGRTDIVLERGRKLLAMARQVGADAIVAACPLCQANLDMREGEIKGRYGDDFNMPVYYFTELMGIAFGHAPKELLLDKHMVDALPLLKSKGLV